MKQVQYVVLDGEVLWKMLMRDVKVWLHFKYHRGGHVRRRHLKKGLKDTEE